MRKVYKRLRNGHKGTLLFCHHDLSWIEDVLRREYGLTRGEVKIIKVRAD